MVVDFDEAQETYQLVIRNSPEILRYFVRNNVDFSAVQKTDSQVVVPVYSGGPVNSLYTGFTGGQSNVVISQISSDVYRVEFWNVGYRGTSTQALANWNFQNCSRP
jgi:hypothetical protein